MENQSILVEEEGLQENIEELDNLRISQEQSPILLTKYKIKNLLAKYKIKILLSTRINNI